MVVAKGQDALLAKMDVVRAYSNIPVDADDRRMKW